MATDVAYTPEESRLASYLNILAAILLVTGFILLLAPFVFRDAPLFIAPPFFFTNTIAGLWLLAFLAWNSAADVRRYRPMIGVLVGGFLIGTIAFMSMAVGLPAGLQEAPLLLGFGLCAAGALVTTMFTRQAKTTAPPWLPWTTDKPISTWERIAQLIFGLFGLASLGAAAGSILTPFVTVAPLADFLVNPFMVAGSAVKIGVLGLCALLVAADVRRFTHHVQMITALVIGHAG